MTASRRRVSRWDALFAGFLVLLFGLLCARASLPNNREQSGQDFMALRTDGEVYYLPRNNNTYDDVVTQVTAHNFARDGFFRTRLLPNRKGAPNVALYDMSQTQCEALEPPRNAPTYKNAFGLERAVVSLGNDCIYTHYPPFADWVFGVAASLGLEHVLYYKLLAILLNSGFLLVFYIWLRGEVRAASAFAACFLLGTSPAFLEWADALYYHSFQYLLLLSGILAWSVYLRRPRRLWFGLAWALFFCEALSSYQLTLFFGVALAGLSLLKPRETALDPRAAGVSARRRRLRPLEELLVLAAAPVLAFLLHFALGAGLLGGTRAFANLARTFTDRVTQTHPGGLLNFIHAFSEGLMPWTLALVAVAVVLVARSFHATRRRPLALLGLFLTGGSTFMALFPGTTSWHGWMMYRHWMPAAVLLWALLAETLVASCRVALGKELTGARNIPLLRHQGARRATALLCTLASAAILLTLVQQNAQQTSGEIAWNLERNRHVDRNNLVRRSLDVVYWNEGIPRSQGVLHMPVSGLRAHEPRAWITDFRMSGPAASHFEVWWLEPMTIQKAQVLVDAREARRIAEHCFVSVFDETAFQRVPESTRVTSAAFVPDSSEPPSREPYSWVRFELPAPRPSRALRLTCSGLSEVALRQVEAFSG